MDDEEEGGNKPPPTIALSFCMKLTNRLIDQEEYGGFHGVREVEGDDSVMEIADDSVQGFFDHKGMYILISMKSKPDS